MKEATGELSMTAIAIVAIVAVGGIFTAFVWPSIKAGLKNKTYCQNAYSCSACTVDPGKDTGTMTCAGYYDEDGKRNDTEITCGCSK